ncbi:hypothetical protein ACIGCM_03815 [Pseudomonas sp. NPDC078700]|uniref:hypothetical protein n=1 Tax=Pseudomonas sp. NPDC078700 TaxID=3364424 RepID=UPI0037CA0BF7
MTTTPTGYTASKPTERYKNFNTGVVYRLALEEGGICTLESIERRTITKSRAELEDANVWRLMP